MTGEQKDAILKYLIEHENIGTLDGKEIANKFGLNVKHVMMLIQDMDKRGLIQYLGMAQYYFQVTITLHGFEFYDAGAYPKIGISQELPVIENTPQMQDRTPDKPYVFIGSSTEGLEAAKAIQAEIIHVCEPHIWSQGIFGLSSGTLDTLVENLTKFDFAIFVLTSDDISISRGQEKNSPRDNVLLELGMFIGSIGQDRTFMVVDESAKIKLPSDLAGITPAFFTPPNKGNMRSAVGAACYNIEAALKKNGLKANYTLNNSNGNFEIDKKLITDYLVANNYTIISYEGLQAMNPDYTQSYILLLLKAYPNHFRFAMTKGKAGIALSKFIIDF